MGYCQGVHSRADDASDFSNVLRNSITSPPVLEYTAAVVFFPVNVTNQSKHGGFLLCQDNLDI